jgi:phosphoribosylamine-glycine ligase
LFYRGSGEENFTGVKAWSLSGFLQAIQGIDTALIEFHNRKGDFEKWATISLRDDELARRLRQIRTGSKVQGEELRENLIDTVQTRLTELKKRFLR